VSRQRPLSPPSSPPGRATRVRTPKDWERATQRGFPFLARSATLTTPHDNPSGAANLRWRRCAGERGRPKTLTTTATTGALAGDVRVGIYLRRSTDDEHQPYSIEAQDARLAAYIGSQPGWWQAARFTDDASGATTARPGLQRALVAARAGVIDVLLVYRVDRLTRSLRDLVTLLDDLDHAGVVFRSATEPFDTATPMGRMLVQMLGMFAQFERDTIIDRVIAGMEREAAAGKWKGGRRPFGYRADGAASTLVPDPGEAAVVRLIFDLYARDRPGARAA
jgi:site-specific DNA recombinase